MEADEDTAKIQTGSPLENQDLGFLLPSVSSFLAEYGWYLLFLSAGMYLLVERLAKRRPTAQHQEAAAGPSRDAAHVVRQQEGLEAARRRMQEELDAKAALFRRKQQELEEEKRREKIEKWESLKEGKSFKGNPKLPQNTDEASTSSVLKSKSDKKTLRNSGYSPLSGDGGGTCTWRPGRRGPSAGG
ncbi:selenoprotein S [Denticeps clupeoides]|uniref:Selenoprotein S n=1 Tax=Denticeps clupeoides TaxID=299321 RepID=A0AAY4E799_9TELE|nr:selenoprotein S [Denticeps clupeoides]